MHLVFDLIYLPEQTLFLNKAKHHGAVIKNGLEMLHLQAQKSWEIWNENK
jgi:shikimate dehydrogenase